MRSGIHGTFATLLLMVPVLSIPALAIFGIPQFAPVVASPLDEGSNSDRERRVGQSARPTGDRFLGELEDAPAFGSEPIDRRSDVPPGRIGESVPLSRSGRRGSERGSSFDQGESRPRTMPANPNPRWADDATIDDNRRPSGFADAPSRNYGDDRSMAESNDQRFDSRQPNASAIPLSKLQQPPIASGDGSQGPRVFQRPRSANVDNVDTRSIPAENEALTWQTAVRKLNDLEIRNFRLQPGHRENQFAFICSYTPKDSPRVSYRFEAEADEPLKAVEKVFEQIAEWQQRRQ